MKLMHEMISASDNLQINILLLNMGLKLARSSKTKKWIINPKCKI
jgi:beta-lactamase class A